MKATVQATVQVVDDPRLHLVDRFIIRNLGERQVYITCALLARPVGHAPVARVPTCLTCYIIASRCGLPNQPRLQP